MTRDEVYKLSLEIAPKYEFDPMLILAICEQESNYNEKAFRLENDFAHWLQKRRPELSIPRIVLHSTSYGLMQLLGQSLSELQFFGTESITSEWIEEYLALPNAQIESGCKWLARKLMAVEGDMLKAIERYNGSGPRAIEYAKSVLTREVRLRKELQVPSK